MEKPNAIPEELCYAATLAKAIIEQNIVLTPNTITRWLDEGFVNENEMDEILTFIKEWS